jgi:hypothetical protein
VFKNSATVFVVGCAIAGALVDFMLLLASKGSLPYPQLFMIKYAPLALVLGSLIGGLVAVTISFLGLGFRKLELICGIATAVVATSLSLFMLKFDWDASLVVEKQFILFRELSLVLLLFMFPGLLVAAGSYVHVGKRRKWGQFVLAAGCFAVMGSFLFLFVILPFGQISTWSLLNLAFVIMAVLSLIFSLLASKQIPQVN